MTYSWQRQTIAATFVRIQHDPAYPWVAIGDFVDDWRRSELADRLELVREAPSEAGSDPELTRWAALCAAAVEWLCWQDELPFPGWTQQPRFWLAEPWFLYPGELLRAWQLVTTPVPFKQRNIFGGDQILSRV